ncbi:MAG: peptidoglycan-binding protein [Candidatus Omnitrophica bacterium]|nr:peptidoglycan-binding protein [Candidatus Omnitrophota bacterium]
MGPQTKEAIKAFQRANTLKPDGIVVKHTWEKLSTYLTD